jgi:hypothetical protein
VFCPATSESASGVAPQAAGNLNVLKDPGPCQWPGGATASVGSESCCPSNTGSRRALAPWDGGPGDPGPSPLQASCASTVALLSLRRARPGGFHSSFRLTVTQLGESELRSDIESPQWEAQWDTGAAALSGRSHGAS